LLTINDRATGFLKMAYVNSKKAKQVELKTIELLEPWIPFIHTITSDNGKEFANHKAIAEELNIDFYFAKPYHSWQRGANENLNGLVRQYFPKKSETVAKGLNFPLHFFSFIFLLPNTIYFAFFQVFQVYKSLF